MEQMQQVYFNVIIFDIEMSGMNGIELLRHVNECSDTDVIIMTGNIASPMSE